MSNDPPNGGKVAITLVVSAIGVLIAAATFSANYLFETKAGSADRVAKVGEQVGDVKESIAELRGEVSSMGKEMTSLRRAYWRSVREQRAMGENLRRLLEREHIRTSRAEDMSIPDYDDLDESGDGDE